MQSDLRNYLQVPVQQLIGLLQKHLKQLHITILHCFANMSTVARGYTGVVVPTMTPPLGYHGTTDTSNSPWSLSFLTKEIEEATGKQQYMFGNGIEKPILGIGSSNDIRIRDASGDYWYCYVNLKSGTRASSERSFATHYSITYEPLGKDSGSIRFYQNGVLLGGQDRTKLGTTDSHRTGSFYFNQIGSGYKSSANTHAFSGSLGCVRYFDYKLPHHEIEHLNRHPEHRANRDNNSIFRFGGTETTLRRVRSNGYAMYTNLPLWATSHSLQPADYRSDHSDSSYYEGSKLTAVDINEPSLDDLEGGPIVKITLRNRYNLVYKKNLPGSANIAVR